MVLAYHLIIGAYGFWLPNDERGSWSDFVRRYELYALGGPATKVNTRRSVAGRPFDREHRDAVRAALKHPPVEFTGIEARCIGRAFGQLAAQSGYRVFACSIMPTHTHLVLGRGRYKVEQMSNLLKGAATRALRADGAYHGVGSPWAARQWKVFLNSPHAIRRAIRYVDDNPIRAGLKRQRWSFVVPYDR